MVYVPPNDRVLETSNSNSQTVFALNGAVDTSYNAFSSAMAIGDTTHGGVVEPGAAFRSGILTYSAANQITITTAKESKGTFSATGTKEVFMGEPAAYAKGPVFAFEGDSLTETTGLGTWPLKLPACNAFFGRGQSYYYATTGETAATMIGEYATQAGALKLGAEAYYFLWAGTNDISNSVAGVPGAATIYGYLTTMWAAARTSGYKVVAFTLLKRSPLDATQEAMRVALNILIRSDPTLYDYLVTPDTLFPSFNDGNFITGGVHLTDPQGNLFLARAVCSTVLGGPILPAAPLDAAAYNGLQVNGSCEVDQEHAGGLVSNVNQIAIDSWEVLRSGTMVLASQQVADAPDGFTNSLKVTVTTAQAVIGAGDYAMVMQAIEGFRTMRLMFGTVNAQPLAIGFWTKHHRTGLYGGAVRNRTIDRSYPFTYTQLVADTWQFNAVPVASGDITGTWQGNAARVGLYVDFAVAAGSTFIGAPNVWAGSNFIAGTGQVNGVAATSDTFQITGLIVLPGIELPNSSRVPLIMRAFPEELRLCQRYYEKSFDYATAPAQNAGTVGVFQFMAGKATTGVQKSPQVFFKEQKPSSSYTVTFYNPSAANAQVRNVSTAVNLSGTNANFKGEHGFNFEATGDAGGSVGDGLLVHWSADNRLT